MWLLTGLWNVSFVVLVCNRLVMEFAAENRSSTPALFKFCSSCFSLGSCCPMFIKYKSKTAFLEGGIPGPWVGKNEVKKSERKVTRAKKKQQETRYVQSNEVKSGYNFLEHVRSYPQEKNIYIITDTVDWDNVSTRKTKYKSKLANSQLVNMNSWIVRTNWHGTTTLHRGRCIKELTNLHTNRCRHR